MKLKFKPLDEASIREIFTWQYPPPYDVYNLLEDKLDEILPFLLDPQNAYYGLWNPVDRLVAFCTFGQDAQVPGGDYSRDALDIGFGLHPDLTGQGMSQQYLKVVLRYAIANLSPDLFRVTIAEFNQRARRAWEKLGFQFVETFPRKSDQKPFVVLTALACNME